MNNFNEVIQKDTIKNYFIHGAVLIDVDGASLNNWGSDATNTQGMDNTSAVKKVFKNGKMYAVIAGQAWRYWWRETLGLNGWRLSPIIRDDKVAYTNLNPIKYADDDIFGYMRASNKNIKDLVEDIEKELRKEKKEEIEKINKEKNKVKKEQLKKALQKSIYEDILANATIV